MEVKLRYGFQDDSNTFVMKLFFLHHLYTLFFSGTWESESELCLEYASSLSANTTSLINR